MRIANKKMDLFTLSKYHTASGINLFCCTTPLFFIQPKQGINAIKITLNIDRASKFIHVLSP